MIAASTAPGVDQMTINVGSGVETSVRDLVKVVISVTGSEPEVVYNPRSDGGPARMCADLRRAASLLNYRPSISLESGLRLTLERDPRLRSRNS
jgi:nucleoside-diphosphate-sugar epimerase